MTFTRLSKVISCVLLVGYAVQVVVPSARQYLALVPGRFIPCVWNVFTAGLLEVTLVKVLLSTAGILLLARIVEPVWGSKEFLIFVSVVNVGSGVSTLVLIYLLYAFTRLSEHSGDLLYQEVSGFQAICAGCLVAVKQIMPDNEVTLLGFIRFRAKLLPALFIALAIPTSIYFGAALDIIPSVVSGTYLAWVYLRFFQRKAETAFRGDPSHEFRLATFLPEVLQPPADQVLAICDKCIPLQHATQASQAGYVPGSNPLPGSDSAEATRRRERGARALEERLGGKKAPAADLSGSDIEAPPVTPGVS